MQRASADVTDMQFLQKCLPVTSQKADSIMSSLCTRHDAISVQNGQADEA